MKTSNYNIIVQDTTSSEVLIYNSLYGSIAIFSLKEYDQVKAFFDKPNERPDCSTEIVDNLIAQKYLIDDAIDELGIIKKRKILGIQDKNRLDLIIMPTLDCNFSCIYCYEDKKPGKMSNKTMEALKKWMTLEIPKFKLVCLNWFGGEPLMGFKQIEEITNHANFVTTVNDVELISHITTNGYSLTKEKIQKLIELRIYNYQITLDGIAEVHDKLRPLKNGMGTFNKVFKNIILLASENPLVKITLRINFNHTNLYSVPELLKIFPEKYRNQLRLSLEPIFGSCEYNATDNLLTDEISKTITSYYKLASKLVYDISIGKSIIETGKFVYCYAERENQLIINYTADVFKCSVYDFNPLNRVGIINKDGNFIKDQKCWNDWMNLPLFDDYCISCKYLPLCMGGCRKTRIQNKNKGSACTLIPINVTNVLNFISQNEFNNLKMIKDS